jgi:hypothetical protein
LAAAPIHHLHCGFVVDTPEDFLESIQPEIERAAEEAEHHTGVDRREFVFMSLMAAAATTFAGRAVAAQRDSTRAGAAAAPAPQQGTPPYRRRSRARPHTRSATPSRRPSSSCRIRAAPAR